MKKFMALLAAAVLIVAAAGCVNKADPSDQASESAAQVSSDAPETEEEIGSVRVTDVSHETVIVTDAEGKSHAVVTRSPKVTQYTTREASPSRLTARPTTTRSVTTRPSRPATTAVRTTKPTTTKAVKTTLPKTTAPSYKEPTVEYGGTLGTEKDSIRITSHKVSLSSNNRFLIQLDVEILACSGTSEFLEFGYICYDAGGKKINSEPIRGIAFVRQNETKTTAIATAPINTAKIVFCNL